MAETLGFTQPGTVLTGDRQTAPDIEALGPGRPKEVLGRDEQVIDPDLVESLGKAADEIIRSHLANLALLSGLSRHQAVADQPYLTPEQMSAMPQGMQVAAREDTRRALAQRATSGLPPTEWSSENYQNYAALRLS